MIELDEAVIGHLRVSQSCVTGGEAFLGMPDVIVVTSSWEPRSTEISKMIFRGAKFGILVLFSEKDSDGGRDSNDRLLAGWLGSLVEKLVVIDNISICDERAIFKRIFLELAKIKNVAGRPLSVFMDISGCPKVYSLAMLGIGFRKGLFSSCSLFYAEAIYSKEEVDEGMGAEKGDRYVFTYGEWRAVQIPYLEGGAPSGADKKMLVSLGLEGEKIKKLIAKYEPDDWNFVIASPGFSEEYAKLGWRENDILFSQYEIKPEKVHEVGVGDLVGCLRRCEITARQWEGDEIIFVALGAKSHAIAMGLLSLVDSRISVLSRLPEAFAKKKTKGNGVVWRYDILDLSSPS